MKTENYKELCTQLDVNIILLNVLKRTQRHLQSVFIGIGAPKGYSSATSYVDADCIGGDKEDTFVTICRSYEEFEKLGGAIAELEGIVAELRKAKEEIDKLLEGDISIVIKVSLLRAKGFTQQEVSELIERDVSTIRRWEHKEKEGV